MGDEGGAVRKVPFYMRVATPHEYYRFDSFWDKEPETLAWIESFGEEDVFWDIGANIGVYTLYAGALYKNMRICAFEPMEINFARLDWNIKCNFWDARIRAKMYAMGDEVKPTLLDIPDPSSGATGAQANDEKGVSVLMETVDHLLDRGFLPPDHVKIDIDGQELRVLKGMKEALWGVKSMLIEVSSQTIRPVLELMLAYKFTTANPFNKMTPHSRERRQEEGIDAENIVFTRR